MLLGSKKLFSLTSFTIFLKVLFCGYVMMLILLMLVNFFSEMQGI